MTNIIFAEKGKNLVNRVYGEKNVWMEASISYLCGKKPQKHQKSKGTRDGAGTEKR